MSQKRTSFWRLFNFRDWRISTKILVLTLMLSLIPLILATGLSIQSSTGALTQQTRINLSRLSFSTAQRIEQFLLDNHNFIRMAASTPAVIKFLSASTEAERADLQEGVDTVVANVLSSNPAIDLVGFYDTQGIVLSHNEASIIGRDYSFRDYVQTALAGAPFTSGIQVGWTTDVPGINASSPVKRDDEVIGAIATRIQGKFITDILISTLRIESEDITEQEREAIDIFLINEYGIIVSHSNESSDWLYHSLGVIDSPEILETIESVRLLGGSCPSDNPECDPSEKTPRLPGAIPSAQPLADTLLTALQIGESGSTRYCQPDNLDQPLDPETCNGTWHVIGYAPVEDPFRVDPNTGTPAHLFMAVVDVPENIFLQSIDQQRTQGTWIAVLMAAITIIASLVVASTLARPIGKLAAAALNVENDEPFEPGDIADITSRGDEVGNFGRVFSHMVVALRARMAELGTIYEIGHTISSSVELRETLFYILDSIVKVIPYDAAEICLYDEAKIKMVMHATTGRDPSETVQTSKRPYDPSKGYLNHLVQKGSLLVSDMEQFTEVRPNPKRTWHRADPRSYLGVPLKVKTEVIGTIEVVSSQPNNFNRDNLRILESIAIQASVAVQNAQEVETRERKLKQQIKELRIEIDQAKRQQEVDEIVTSDYFQSLGESARRIRSRVKRRGQSSESETDK